MWIAKISGIALTNKKHKKKRKNYQKKKPSLKRKLLCYLELS